MNKVDFDNIYDIYDGDLRIPKVYEDKILEIYAKNRGLNKLENDADIFNTATKEQLLNCKSKIQNSFNGRNELNAVGFT